MEYIGFTSDHGYLPYGQSEIIDVHIIAPLEENQGFTGEIKVANKDNINDFELIPVYIKTPRIKTIQDLIILRFFDTFPILQRILNLIR